MGDHAELWMLGWLFCSLITVLRLSCPMTLKPRQRKQPRDWIADELYGNRRDS